MLLGLLWLVPAFGLAAFSMHRVRPAAETPPAALAGPTKVPIEVRFPDKGSRIVYVEIDSTNVPEPSTAILVSLSASLLFLRRR